MNELEQLLKELQGYMKDWAIIEPETTLILGNARRMLYAAYKAGRNSAVDEARAVVEKNFAILAHYTDHGYVNETRKDILHSLESARTQEESPVVEDK